MCCRAASPWAEALLTNACIAIGHAFDVVPQAYQNTEYALGRLMDRASLDNWHATAMNGVGRRRFLSWLCVAWPAVLGASGCNDSRSGSAQYTVEHASDEELWERLVAAYLTEPLWCDSSSHPHGLDLAYDAGHHLMIPVHAAFALDRQHWQRQIADFWSRYMVADPAQSPSTVLGRLQFLYVASRFVVLATDHARAALVPTQLPALLMSEVRRFWSDEPAWLWGRDPFPGGMRERLQWKLETPSTTPGYLRAIFDEEMFLLSIAADLRSYDLRTRSLRAGKTVLEEILEMAFRVFTQEVEWRGENEGWLLQPGVWAEHPDFAFAGQPAEIPGMQPMPVPGIAADTSHSHRLPLWIRSLQRASADRPEHAAWYASLVMGLDRQIRDHVIVAPDASFPAYRTTNFMDGNNGVYRWNYATHSAGDGYGPYELSGTLMLGWWSFLGSRTVRQIYELQASIFPLAPSVIDLYVGPNSTRAVHPLVRRPDFYTNGFGELVSRLALAVSDSADR